MWFVALALATLCFFVFIAMKMKGYQKYAGKALYWTIVFTVIFIIGKSLEYFGY